MTSIIAGSCSGCDTGRGRSKDSLLDMKRRRLLQLLGLWWWDMLLMLRRRWCGGLVGLVGLVVNGCEDVIEKVVALGC